MRALSSLISLNEPDLTLFVGEALVGNDAVDQLTKFNQRLADLARTPNAQMIQGLVLTKMDTIDDKVCARAGFLSATSLMLRAFLWHSRSEPPAGIESDAGMQGPSPHS